MYSFCTYFDQNYLTRGLALYRSLERHCPAFELWILCLDNECHQVLSQLHLPHARLIPIDDLETADPELAATRETRSWIEYYFTCTPALSLHLLRRQPQIDAITYLDADLFFFSNPEPLFEELGDAAVGIIAHRFPEYLHDRERYGRFNVGWVTFRRDDRALACLTWWRERCIEWCYDRLEDDRFADQKYLDQWPTRFPGVKVLEHGGANVAAWNLYGHEIRIVGDAVHIDAQPLIFFHFHGFRRLTPWVFDPNFAEYGLRANALMRHSIIGPYVQAVAAAWDEVAKGVLKYGGPRGADGTRGWGTPRTPSRAASYQWGRLVWFLMLCAGVLGKRYVLILRGHAV